MTLSETLGILNRPLLCQIYPLLWRAVVRKITMNYWKINEITLGAQSVREVHTTLMSRSSGSLRGIPGVLALSPLLA